MAAVTDVTIIGAGPYGLSIAAHLRDRGLSHRIVGIPMESWRTQMPKGMLLKSEGFASGLYDRRDELTLRAFCAERGTAYADYGHPVPLEVFLEYGLEFQRRFVPHLECKELVGLAKCPEGFRLQLANGEVFDSRRVVVAVGIRHFRYIPAPLDALPPHVVSHSSEHHDLERFKGCDVTVIGAGSSASDLAALLVECGANARLLTRRTTVPFGEPMRLPRPLSDRIKYPMSPIGPGWRTRFCANAPWLFHYLPEKLRVRVVKRLLGPAGGWFMKQRCEQASRVLGCEVDRAEVDGQNRVVLHLVDRDGGRRQISTDHVIAATGYRVRLDKLPFLQPDLQARIRCVESAPVLSSSFESSVHGLYFVGPASQVSFGPLMRFACGAKFSARRLSSHLATRIFAERLKVTVRAAAIPAGSHGQADRSQRQRGET
jgi:FAD-dependent urate hydroxylase